MNNIKRETINIDKYSLNMILGGLRGSDEELADQNEVDKYELAELNINGHDTDDGGTSYTGIIKRKKDGKFFSIDFHEWDIWWEYAPQFDAMPEKLEEVFPKTKTITVYE